MKGLVSNGEFIPTKKFDILCKATNKKEHPGRVRTAGSFFCQRDVFGASTSSKPTNNSKFKKLENDVVLANKRQDKRDIAIQIMAKKMGAILPDNLDDITPDWEPQSIASANSFSDNDIEVEGVEKEPDLNFNPIAPQVSTQTLVSVLFTTNNINYYLYFISSKLS